MAETRQTAVVRRMVVFQAYCSPCGLMDGWWESPLFTFESEAIRAKKLHDEAMGH